MKILILVLVTLLPVTAMACEPNIPVSVINSFGKPPTGQDGAEFIILAPEEYDGWRIRSAVYKKGKNAVSIAPYRDQDEFGDANAYVVNGTIDFFEDSWVELFYVPIPKVREDGNVSGTLCGHVQRVDWGI